MLFGEQCLHAVLELSQQPMAASFWMISTTLSLMGFSSVLHTAN